jgi:hypothetical protein
MRRASDSKLKTGDVLGYNVVDNLGYFVSDEYYTRKDARRIKNSNNRKLDCYCPYRIVKVVVEK